GTGRNRFASASAYLTRYAVLCGAGRTTCESASPGVNRATRKNFVLAHPPADVDITASQSSTPKRMLPMTVSLKWSHSDGLIILTSPPGPRECATSADRQREQDNVDH